MEWMGVCKKAQSTKPVGITPPHGCPRNTFDKCIFRKEKIDFLGHEILPAGVCPTASKVKAIEKFPEPQNTKALQEFLGMINYYRQFIPNVAQIMHPLTSFLKGKPKALTWEVPQQKAFSETKAALTSATT
ncbi:uncharacterized protein [Macrobrachium rosenbergii]|uniref:uncharacterized protein n=1 Tax=Macrobrachium rosenbergii TaxID=79674 RepID=UPI0034D6F640